MIAEKSLPILKELHHSENQIKNIFKNKIGKIISLHINQIQISEFMTRSQAIDEDHVNTLMTAIQEEDYLPESSIWVNAVSGADGSVFQYRLIAGRHRFEACRRLDMQEISALIFHDLTDEEECIADRISNQKDFRHKKVGYMEEAMHCLYLKETKGWSTRQIARAKGVSKSNIFRKIQIAKLPESVKDIFVTVPNGDTFKESYFREILKLKQEPHQILLCKKILGDDQDTSNNNTEKTEHSESKTPAVPPDVKKMVKELLLFEAQGKIAEEAMKYFKDEKIEGIDSISIITEEETEDISSSLEEEAWQMVMGNAIGKEAGKREKGMRYITSPMWFRHCKSKIGLNLSAFYLLLEIIGNDLRYTPEKNEYFFIKQGSCYETTEQYLAAIIDVQERTLIKKLLPSISEYVSYYKPGDVLKFKVNWNRLFELYKRTAFRIPFHDGGLAGIPEGFTGKVYPTPYHCLFIENGQVKQVSPEGKSDISLPENKPGNIEVSMFRKPGQEVKEEITIKAEPVAETAAEDNKAEAEVTEEELTENPVAVTLKNIGMAKKQIICCLQTDNIETTLNVMKYIREMPPQERENIKNLPGYIYGLIKNGFSPPTGFISYKEVQKKAERKVTVDNVASTIRRYYEAGKKVFFCPKEDVSFPIERILDMIFMYHHKSRGLIGGSFAEWPDLKYFRVEET